ncbi:MAG: hypothetical protein ACRYHQ_24420 [Janthinobacterium lividum]
MTIFEAEAEARILAAEGQLQMSRAIAYWVSRTVRTVVDAAGRALSNHPIGVLPQ